MSHSPSWLEGRGSRITRQLVTLPPLDTQRGKYWCSAHFLFLIQSGTSANGIVLPTFRTGVQRSVFKVIQDPVDNITISSCYPVSFLKFL